MSKPANKTLIGIFVLGAIALLGLAIVMLGSGRFFQKTFKAVCFFEGSVGGLNVGAPVVFRGVRVGSVRDIVLRYDTRDLTTNIPVYIEIEASRIKTIGSTPESLGQDLKLLIDNGLRARLELQSLLTGQLQVGLDSYPDKPARFVGSNVGYPEIPTVPTAFQEITRKIEQLPLEEIITNVAAAVDGINRVVHSPDITRSIQSVSRAADETTRLVQSVNAKVGPTLAKIDGAVTETQALVQNLNSNIRPVSSDVQQTLKEAQALLRQINEKAAILSSSIEATMKDTQRLVRNIDQQIEPLGPSIQKTLSSLEKASEEAGATLRQAQQTLEALEGGIGEDSELAYELKRTVNEIGTAVRAIQNLARGLEQQPESILFGKKRKLREIK